MLEQPDLHGVSLEVIEPDGARRTVPVGQTPFLIGRGAEAFPFEPHDSARNRVKSPI